MRPRKFKRIFNTLVYWALGISMTRTLILLALLSPIFTYAAEYMPFPKAKISIEQWDEYFQEIKTDYANSEQFHSKYNLVTYNDVQTKMSFAFTTKGHPAHPSWVTRQVVEKNQRVSMQQIGYFAGDEKAFAILFKQYATLSEQIKKEFSDNEN